MLPTFIITLREGVEAALIVGIIAAFLVRQGHAEALRLVWAGVALASALCLAIALALRVAGNELSESQQEGLSTVVTVVAVSAVTYMIVWMSRHARELRGRLQRDVSTALASGSTWALIAMAFFAVLREGFETTVFLLALFDRGADATPGIVGAVLGLLVAVALGWGLYRGGVRLDLARFFRFTAAVLVLVAAGLVASALGAATEAGWVTAGQAQVLDLSWLLSPGSVQESLVTGMLGIPAEPTAIQVIAYLAYAVPMLFFVLAPEGVGGRVRTGLAGAAVSVAPLALLVGTSGENPSSGAEAASGAARTVQVAISDAGCEPASLRLPSGPTTFEVSSSGASGVTEYEVVDGDLVLGEAENLTAGLKGSFSTTLQPGRYELRCPGGSSASTGELVVTGKRVSASDDPLLRRGIAAYRAYLVAQTGLLQTRVAALRVALRSGDVAAARRAYASARIPWERAEPLGELLGGLDPAFDARANDYPRSQWARRWFGFHPIERQLWVKGTTAGTAIRGRRLAVSSRRLSSFARSVRLDPVQIANGANALINEVGRTKITGEEERYSHIDLLDFQANVEGSEAAFAAIRPVLARSDAPLAREVSARFSAVYRALDRYRRGGRFDFVSYGTVGQSQRRKLAQTLDALAEPLSQTAARALAP